MPRLSASSQGQLFLFDQTRRWKLKICLTFPTAAHHLTKENHYIHPCPYWTSKSQKGKKSKISRILTLTQPLSILHQILTVQVQECICTFICLTTWLWKVEICATEGEHATAGVPPQLPCQSTVVFWFPYCPCQLKQVSFRDSKF